MDEPQELEHAKPQSWMRRHAFAVALFAVIALHLGLTFGFENPAIIFGKMPNAWLDYDTHIEQSWRVTEALHGWGKAWAYDPYLLAGYPNGTIFDADNKAWELWTFALSELGVPRGTAFNLFILLSHLLVPWIAFASARLFKFDKWAALTAAFLSLVVWFFDAFPHWCWWVGMIAWGMAAYLFLLPLGLFYRFVKEPRWYWLAPFAVVLGLAHLVHPYTFVILILPLSAIYFRAFRQLSWRSHAGVAAAVLVVLAMNAYWLAAALQFWHYILNSAYYCQSTLSFFFTDYLGLLKEPLVTGVLSNRSGFKFIVLAAAAIGLAVWRGQRDDRFWPLAVGACAMLAVAYLGGYSLVFSQIQPYRAAMPATYYAVLPAAALLTSAFRSGALRGLGRLTVALYALIAGVALIGLLRDVLYFTPAVLPDPGLRPEDKFELRALNTGAHPEEVVGRQMRFYHRESFKDFGDIANWLLANDDGQGRVLVEWWILGEHLAWRSHSQILGGFLERNLEHSAANLFRRMSEREVSRDEVRRYFEDYAVKWIILSRPDVELEKQFSDLLEPVGYIKPIHRVYKPKGMTPSYFAQNRGKVGVSLNRLEVTGTDPRKDVVLRFHTLETLVCRPGCAVRKEPLEHDKVGFIRVPAPHPADFVIENGY